MTAALSRGADAPHGVSAPRRSPFRRRRSRDGLLAVLPALMLIVGFFVIPLTLMFWMSLNNWPLLGSTQRLIGARNYLDIVGEADFWQAVGFTTVYTSIITPIEVVLGYLLAALVRSKFRGVGFFRTSFFLPVVVGFASGAYVFLVLVQPDSGFFDQVLQGLQITDGPVPWLTDPTMALLTVILMTVWKTLGTSVILMMVGMQAIPAELTEAGLVDGARAWQRERFITLPLMRPTIALVLILTLTGSFLAFDQFFIMTHGGPNQSTVTIVMWIYTEAFVRYRLGFSAAGAVILLALLIVFTILQIFALRDRPEGSSR